MSRGFVKEGDQEELPIVPPRAALPPGVTNYVTPGGYEALLAEKTALEEEKSLLPKEHEREYRQGKAFIDAKLNLLNERINSARIIENKNQDPDQIRFGARVRFQNGKNIQTFQIVGVDEADIKKHKIAFTAPIAKIMIGKKTGDTAEFKRGKESQFLKILEISYPD